MKKNKKDIVNFVNKQLKKNKKIFLYGASTKGNTFLQYYNLDNKKIPYSAERTPTKWGRYTIGTGIKIIPEDEARNLNPDYFLVTPWSFIKEFVKEKKIGLGEVENL